MKKGFAKLSDMELEWLEGKIGIFDVQKGCPHQCIICATSAEKYSKSISWKDFSDISESIAEVKIKKNINLLVNEGIMFFDSSDPIFYNSKDGLKIKTIYDITNKFHQDNDISSFITTAGWRSGENYMQKAAEDIVENFQDLGINYIMYSIKTVTPKIMNEYALAFNKEFNIPSISDKRRYKKTYKKISYNKKIFSPFIKKFVRESDYTAQLINNISTLMPLKKKVNYDLQHICKKDIALDFLNNFYYKYDALFSISTVASFFNLAIKDIGSNVNINDFNHTTRYFSGFGHALDSGFSMHNAAYSNLKKVTSKSLRSTDKFNVLIDADGRLNIYFGEYDCFSKTLVPKKYFNDVANDNISNKKTYDTYLMLTNLQGKSLLE